ncbi:hypothetical protein [Shewanella halifaxensis]|uniref:hypothetical protein n=1 Tax=Shewanella halifaxensis TaxID=271098 RepID=UPI001F1FA2A5|nr:hypothetical protein [Shewanella halifaxensis]
MRRSVKYRLLFLLSAIVVYCAGFQWLPETIEGDGSLELTLVVAAGYFVLLPMLYAYCIIYVGQQAWWKMLIILSLSSLMARFSFPAELASYFEFIAWLRYPIIAVLLIIELVLVVSIVKALWQARSLKGDPRLHIIDKYPIDEEKKRSLALVLASEPASWYYAIPWFSRHHSQNLAHLNLFSAKRWHWCLLIVTTLSASVLTYMLIANWSELLAVVISSIVAYSLVVVTANYRVSRYFSVYVQEQKLVLNNAMWGFLAVKLDDIESAEFGTWSKTQRVSEGNEAAEMLCFGRGATANIKLSFKQPQTYFGAGGQLPEQITQLYLVVDSAKELQCQLQALLDQQPLVLEAEELLNKVS